MSRHIGAVLDRFIHLETIVLHCFKVLHVLEHNAFPVDPGLAPELQVGLLSVSQLEAPARGDRKSTRLNSSHTVISYAVFCLKKKKKTKTAEPPTNKGEDDSDIH